MSNDLRILNLFFEDEDYRKLIAIIDGELRPPRGGLLEYDAILLCTKDKARVLEDNAKKPFSRLSMEPPEASE